MMTIETFQTMLDQHDWFYYMSDDSRAVRAGEESSRRIRNALTELHCGPDGFAAQKLFDAACAEHTW